MRVRRTVTRPYSPATKNALSTIRTATPTSSRKRVTTPPTAYEPGVWEVKSRPTELRRSIGDVSVVACPRGPALKPKVLEMRERLHDGETAITCAEPVAEHLERDLVGRLRLGPERSEGGIEARAVVLEQLAGPSGRVVDRLAVAGERDPRRELDRARERREVIPERVGPRARVEADRRRDPRQQVVARYQHPVAEQAEVPVGVTRQMQHVPARNIVALLERLRVPGEPDHGPETGGLVPDRVRDRGRRPVQPEVVGQLSGPVRPAPDVLGARVVLPSLQHRRARRGRGRLGAPDVVGVEVRDDDAVDGRVELREELAPVLLGAGERNRGVDERPAVLAAQQVAVDMPGAHGERGRESEDAGLDLLHRPIQTARAQVP